MAVRRSRDQRARVRDNLATIRALRGQTRAFRTAPGIGTGTRGSEGH